MVDMPYNPNKTKSYSTLKKAYVLKTRSTIIGVV